MLEQDTFGKRVAGRINSVQPNIKPNLDEESKTTIKSHIGLDKEGRNSIVSMLHSSFGAGKCCESIEELKHDSEPSKSHCFNPKLQLSVSDLSSDEDFEEERKQLKQIMIDLNI